MAILSKLRLFANVRSGLNFMPFRSSGHERKMIIQNSNHNWNTFKDMLHFYFMLGIIPLTVISIWANIFVGEAELSEIPEGYIPHEHEYYKHPISRFLKKYLVSDKVIGYESHMARLNEEAENVILSSLRTKLYDMMEEKNDNKSWMYRPMWVENNRYMFHWHNQMTIQNAGIVDSGNEGEVPKADW